MTNAKPIQLRGQPIAAGKLPLVCLPLVAGTEDALLAEAKQVLAKKPDVIEWRADFFEQVGKVDAVLACARHLRQMTGVTPMLFTCRSASQGGQPIELSSPQVAALCEAVCAARSIELIDFEMDNALEDVQRVVASARGTEVTVVLSHHDFDATPRFDELARRFRMAQDLGADVAKLAVMPSSLDDVLALLNATFHASRLLAIPVVGMAMGQVGSVSRLIGWMFGSAMTFAVGSRSSAPGQIAVDDLNAAIASLRRACGG